MTPMMGPAAMHTTQPSVTQRPVHQWLHGLQRLFSACSFLFPSALAGKGACTSGCSWCKLFSSTMDSSRCSAHTHGFLVGLGSPAAAPGVGESCFIQAVRLPVVQNSFGPMFTTCPGSAQVPRKHSRKFGPCCPKSL